jgi:hypothetical protein
MSDLELRKVLQESLETLKSRIADQTAAKKEAETSMMVAHNNLQQLVGAIHAYENMQSIVGTLQMVEADTDEVNSQET